MNELLNEHINYCYESVKRALVLRGIINSPSQDEIITLNTRYIPLHSSDVLDVLHELSQDSTLAQNFILAEGTVLAANHKIEILDHQQLKIAIPMGAELEGFNERYEYIIDMKVKADIKKLYFDELKKLELNTVRNGKLMEFNKQIAMVKKILEEKKVNLSKRTFDFSFDDLPDSIAKNINLYLVLLWIEKDLEYPLKIESSFIPVTKIGIDDNYKSIHFSLSLGKLIFRGDTYTIDLNECFIKFDNDDESYNFKLNTIIGSLLRILIIESKEKISHREAVERLGEGNVPKNEILESAKVSQWLGTIRKRKLKTTYGEDRDIILNIDGFLKLRK